MATLTVTTSTSYIGQDLTDTTQIVFDSVEVVVATFEASQFGSGQISESVDVVIDDLPAICQVNVLSISGTFSIADWTFSGPRGAIIFMRGADSADTITGNDDPHAGNTFQGGLGADTLIGGALSNRYFYVSPAEVEAGETVTGNVGFDELQIAGVGGNFDFSVATLTDIDRITFTPGLAPTQTTVTVTGDQIAAGIVTINNASGGPSILNVFGNGVNLSSINFIDWTPPTDKVMVSGTSGANSLIGSSQPDTISGAGSNDVIRGGGGNDVLIGGKGRDVMYGDAGHDRFDFNSLGESRKGSMRDMIQKFSHADDIDLRSIDAKTGSGNQKFKWIGKQDFHDQKGELHYIDKGSKCLIQGDVNGDGKADFEILVNVGALSAGDFLL